MFINLIPKSDVDRKRNSMFIEKRMEWNEFIDQGIDNMESFANLKSSFIQICGENVTTRLTQGLSETDIEFCKWALTEGGVKVMSYKDIYIN